MQIEESKNMTREILVRFDENFDDFTALTSFEYEPNGIIGIYIRGVWLTHSTTNRYPRWRN